MKLPIISRAVAQEQYEQLERNTVRALDFASARAERAEKQYDDLMARFTMLKLQGFAEPTPTVTMPTAAIDPVFHAINVASAGKDARVRRGMIAQAAADKAASVPQEEIIARIQRGNRPAEEVA